MFLCCLKNLMNNFYIQHHDQEVFDIYSCNRGYSKSFPESCSPPEFAERSSSCTIVGIAFLARKYLVILRS